MIVSTKGRYALRVMIDLAEHQSEKYVPLKEVATRQEISEKYLENILKVLVQNGFLEGLRGKGGGYRLTRSPDQYTVSEILMLTEGSLAPVSCLTPGASACARMANCRTYEMWKGLNDLISDYFGKITLADLALPDQAGNDYDCHDIIDCSMHPWCLCGCYPCSCFGKRQGTSRRNANLQCTGTT